MKLVLSHPTGNANVRAAAYGFVEAEILFQFYTTIAVFPDSLLNTISSIGPLAEFKRRSFSASLRPFTHTYPGYEIGRLFASKLNLQKLIYHEKGIFSIDAIYRTLDTRVANNLRNASTKGANAVYAYEDAAVNTFKKGKELGFKCFYDLPIGYWRAAQQLLENENYKWPEYKETLVGFKDSQFKLQKKDEELQLADSIFVASTFTAKTLQHFPGTLASVKVIPYGFPNVAHARHYKPLQKRRLKLLFVGGLSQRKGIANLFSAVEKFEKHVELTIVGRRVTDDCKALNANLKKHNWIESLPHSSILELMQHNDVLVFPSLFEGFGLVITEAMSQGTPVITTDRTAGPDLITNGESGWLIEAGSTEAIEKSIEDILCTPEIVEASGKEAMHIASNRSWKVYGQELSQALIESL
ncbi:MAG: glycosyltransferase family 4 protein [Bacteroidota bacterium]|nr:glycosyltransferase family 4 protein [Bacteroidota bacterium]